MNKHCHTCAHFWRDDGEDVCVRERRDNPPTTESERLDGFWWSLAFGSCGKRGRYYVSRAKQ